MKYFRLFLTTSAALLAAPAFAGSTQPLQVVELFTSQGCSSCPPANETITQLTVHDDILSLSYSVTYWDYLGWKDTFGKPAFTDRQRSYGKAFDGGQVYTPQIILNGAAHSSRYSLSDIRSFELGKQADVSITAKDDMLLAEIDSADETDTLRAVLVEYVPGPQSIAVKAGENRGRVLRVSNVVTNIRDLGELDADTDAPIETGQALSEGKGYALLMHDPDTKRIVAAANYLP